MASSNAQTDQQGEPVIVSMNSRDFRTITQVCRSACRHDGSEILFTLLVEKQSRQVREIAIPKQTATPAHCDALPGEDLRIAEGAAPHGYAIYKAHSHGRSFNFSSSTDWNCATSLHATCAANCVRREFELPVSVENGCVCLGQGGAIRLLLPEGITTDPVGGWRAQVTQMTGESAFYTFNAHGDKPCGVGLRLTTHPPTDEVTSHVVCAKVRIRKSLPPALQHWTRERIDAEVDSKLQHSDGILYVNRLVDRGVSDGTGDTEARSSEAQHTKEMPDVAICVDSGVASKTVTVLPLDVFQQALGQVAGHDESGILGRIHERLPDVSADERANELVEN